MSESPQRRLPPASRTAVAAAACALAAALLLPGGCSDPDPRKDARLLVVDGITITFDDLQPYVEFLASFRPEDGVRTRNMDVLLRHVLPLAFARRAFGPARAEQRALAQGLCDVAANVQELEQQTRLMEHKRRSNLTRTSARLPLALWLFDPLHTFQVSPPLELPYGWVVAASYDLHQSPMLTTDYADTLQVGFLTHTAQEWGDWWQAEQQRITDKVTFVHPDYVDDLPPWLHLPKKP